MFDSHLSLGQRSLSRWMVLPLIGLLLASSGCQTMSLKKAELLPNAQFQTVPAEHAQQFQAARSLEQQNNLPEAIRVYESMIQSGMHSAPVFHRLAVLYDQTGQSDRSLPLYEQARQWDPNNADLICDLGFRAYSMGDPIEANRLYELALDKDPNHARTHNNLAVMLAQYDERSDAQKHFTVAGLSAEEMQHNMNLAQQFRANAGANATR